MFDNRELGYKSSKNQEYFKNYFVNESSNASPTIYNFCGKGWYISIICSLRNGSQNVTIFKTKKIWIENLNILTLNDPRR